ncbi:MAG TPA: polysaccharide deacetylase family protein, partial [Clostridia bacterium]|nr:polysaccharide deacetylase family protein [Clostridia bacterium]
YGEAVYGFKRGQLIGYRMDYYDREDLIGRMLLDLEGTHNAYQIKSPYEIYHSALTFVYPLPKESILPEVRDKIYPGQLPEDFMGYVKKHYIGNPDVNSVDQLPGFTKEEVSMLDKRGKVDFVNDVAFFTFDDWGTDVPITKLLDVLRKHNVKATFCVRTRYVLDNPALLRAIAMEGHEIVSHTHNHLPLSNLREGDWSFDELSDVQVQELKQDIQDSYDTLQNIVGDIRMDNGKPALSTFFRPPTLAVGRKGMEAVFDMGITYIVSGEYTSHDYEAESAEGLLRNLRLNVRNGTIVVMHFSDNSVNTADAVDQYLTMNETNQNRKQYSFARLSDYLGN